MLTITRNIMQNNAEEQNKMLNQILAHAEIGWWRANSVSKRIAVADFLQKLLGVGDGWFDFEQLLAMVREDYRERVRQRSYEQVTLGKYDYIFPVSNNGNEYWFHTYAVERLPETDGSVTSVGYAKLIPNPEVNQPVKASSLRINNLLYQLNSISKILLSFLKSDTHEVIVHQILRDILKQFRAGRTYIFEYNWENATQSCTYEVVDENVTQEQELLTELPFSENKWWTEQILSGKSIILSDLDELPEEANDEKAFLELQDIRSLIVVPLVSRNGVWGYAGIDIVDGTYVWSEEDRLWFTSLVNIISIVLELQRSEKIALQDKADINQAYNKIAEFEQSFSIVSQYAKIGYCKFDLLTREGDGVPQWYYNLGEEPNTPLNEIIGVYKSVHEEDRERIFDSIRKVKAGESNGFFLDLRVRMKDNSWRWTQINVVRNPANKDRSKIEMICVNYDVTNLKETEKRLIEAKERAEVSDRLKSAFLANVSHEIRTPLNAIVGFSSLLAETDDIEERASYTTIVQENNELLLQLISDILDLSKIEAGTLDIVYDVVDVNQLCREVIDTYKLKIKESELTILFEDYLPCCCIFSDKNRIKQIIGNFMNNALKFTVSGEIALGYKKEGEDKLKFFVRDTGCGISEKDRETVFERFIKLNNFVQGTGLGLPICRSLVEQMGGEIGVESEEGVGSYFWFTHPYRTEKD